MQVFLHAFAETIADDEHVALVLDGAGWQGSKALRVPSNITLVPLPPYSPEINPVERVWLYLKERFLSLRLHSDSGDRRCRVESLATPAPEWALAATHSAEQGFKEAGDHSRSYDCAPGARSPAWLRNI
jgi:hypothetical protein